MNISVQSTLMELGVPKELIHIEQFGGNIEASQQQTRLIKKLAETGLFASWLNDSERQYHLDAKFAEILQCETKIIRDVADQDPRHAHPPPRRGDPGLPRERFPRDRD